MKKTSIKDIATHLNVSVATVSLTLNKRGDEKRISQETQKRIIQYAQERNYKPNIFAKGLRKGRSEILGLIIPNISDSFYARIASQIEKIAAKQGYKVIYSSSEESGEKESELIHSMLDQQVEGLIIASTQKNKKDILKLKRMKFPFVLIDRHYPGIETDYVIADDRGGTEMAVKHLLDQNISRIGLVTLKPGLDAIKNRFLGYKNTLEKHGIDLKPEYVHELSSKMETYTEEMKLVFDSYQNMDTQAEAIIFSTHYLAACGLREIRSRNLNVPNDYKVVSYDENSTFDLIEPPITVVTQPVKKIGEQAVEILLEKLKSDKNETTQVILDTGFIIRKSCGE